MMFIVVSGTVLFEADYIYGAVIIALIIHTSIDMHISKCFRVHINQYIMSIITYNFGLVVNDAFIFLNGKALGSA